MTNPGLPSGSIQMYLHGTQKRRNMIINDNDPLWSFLDAVYEAVYESEEEQEKEEE